MSQDTSYHAPEIGEDMAFQSHDWMAERIGWGVMVLVIVAALLGLFAVGPMSWTTSTDTSGLLRVDYGRIQRQTAPASLKLDVDLAAVTDRAIELQLDQTFLEFFDIDSMQPEPAEAVATAQGLRLRFRAEPGQGRATIYVQLTPQAIGLRRTRLGLAGHEPVELSYFIYP
ncbi:hypothetical protein [Rubellimicrobium roseum]|uniref:Uncharacterized protein n=1 Tax=Rubellimicrobium roseum TaxID=687525 RepID=A0A5C4N6C6_9RHOB|nr:hypothetical protein [Rubellimicrobium roseum]TNC66283.1 hypothetical protein FHG71_16865 [Rubellimicrobium roseum]